MKRFLLEVLLMQWNSHLPWGTVEYSFVELFSGQANVSREWCETQTATCLAFFIFSCLSAAKEKKGLCSCLI